MKEDNECPMFPHELYECDPAKNTLCSKRGCGNPCTLTTHREFAKTPGERKKKVITCPVCGARITEEDCE